MAFRGKAIFTNKDIRNRILFTLFAFLVYRLGSAITVPDVNTADLVAGIEDNSLFAMINLLGGGGLEQFSIFALGVTPYITASIIIQLLSMDVVPHLSELAKNGATGRKTLDKYTRYLAVVFAFVQSFSLVYGFSQTYTTLIEGGVTMAKIMYIATIFTAGSMFLVWIGDQISIKGIGNGISMVIMAGIVGRMPQQFADAWTTLIGAESTIENGAWLFAGYILVYLLIIIFVTLINTAERRIPIQYTSSSIQLSKRSESNYLPLKVNSASVIPVIFALSILQFPLTITYFMDNQSSAAAWIEKWLSPTGTPGVWVYAAFNIVLIIFFTYFYTSVTFNPVEVAQNMKANGGFIPGIRPGKATIEYLNRVMTRITFVGALFLAAVAILPTVVSQLGGLNFHFGGTSLLIAVGVALDTMKQLEQQMVMRNYQGFLK